MVAQPNLANSGNTLHIPPSIHPLPGEKLVRLIRHSRVWLYCKQLPVGAGLLLVLIFAVTVALYRPDLWWIEAAAVVMVLALLVKMLVIFIEYRYNICLLTNRRIINIKRSTLLIKEARTVTQYDNIRGVIVSVTTLFERLFHIGTVDIDTLILGPQYSDIRLTGVDDPFDIQKEVYLLRDQFARRHDRLPASFLPA